MRGCGFSFDYVDFSNHKFHKVIPKHVGSYVGSPILVKYKKATINPVNKDNDKCFQFAVTVALNQK